MCVSLKDVWKENRQTASQVSLVPPLGQQLAHQKLGEVVWSRVLKVSLQEASLAFCQAIWALSGARTKKGPEEAFFHHVAVVCCGGWCLGTAAWCSCGRIPSGNAFVDLWYLRLLQRDEIHCPRCQLALASQRRVHELLQGWRVWQDLMLWSLELCQKLPLGRQLRETVQVDLWHQDRCQWPWHGFPGFANFWWFLVNLGLIIWYLLGFLGKILNFF